MADLGRCGGRLIRSAVCAATMSLGLGGLVASASNIPAHADEWASAPAREALDLAIEQWRAALLTGSRNQLEAIISSRFVYRHGSGRIEDKRTFIDRVTPDPAPFKDITLSDQSIFAHPEVAVVRQVQTTRYIQPAVRPELRLSMLMIWRVENGHWRLAAQLNDPADTVAGIDKVKRK